MALAGSGSLLAVAWETELELWNVASGELMTTVNATPRELERLYVLSVDAAGSLVAGIFGRNVLLWHASSGAPAGGFEPGNRFGSCWYCGVDHLALAPAGDTMAVAGSTSSVLLVNTASGEVTRELDSGGDVVNYVAFGADGAMLASASYVDADSNRLEYALRVWDTTTFDMVFDETVDVDPGRSARFAFRAGGGRFAVASMYELVLLHLDGGRRILPFDYAEDHWFRALSPDGTQAALELPGDGGSKLAIVDVASRAVLTEFLHIDRGFAAWSDDGRLLIAGSELASAAEFEVLASHSRGKLHHLDLVVAPRYVTPQTYDVSGTVRMDDGAEYEFSGSVHGQETQRYLRPQARPPMPTRLEIDLHGHPWILHGNQSGNSFYPPAWNTDDGTGWWGYAVDRTLPEGSPGHRFQLWRPD